MRLIIICLLSAMLLTACGVAIDPLGMTERTRIRADAQVKSAIGVAEQQRMAEEAKAKALVDAEALRQSGANQRTATIMLILPVALIVLCVGGIVALIVHWRGKIAFEQTCQRAFGRPHTMPTLPRHVQAALAERHCRGEFDGYDWWAVYQPTGQRLPQPITRLLEIKL